eukprot:CAMPEP_0194269170 /NCGR_PEP_ID=MMETSP0169-20130528/3368_1 /TAXON_ID=218684 /ORGANISM="Corethron pennatum, Strain L29A3" /LENGTH=375 /DNA_ID=CAMNT_0039010707 /DNA_START=165 /DNA_END=1292 /DNA_ORIENTATION=+
MDQSAAEAPQPRSLPDPPSDGVTSLSYLPSTAPLLLGLESGGSGGSATLLLSTSWDGRVRLHDTSPPGRLVANVAVPGSVPVLDHCVCVGGDVNVYASCLDGSIVRYDVRGNAARIVGSHPDSSEPEETKGLRCVCTVCGRDGKEWLATAGWDGRLVVWDINGEGGMLVKVADAELPGKAFSIDSRLSTLAVATSGRRVCIFTVGAAPGGKPDLRLVEERESGLKYQTRILRIFPGGSGMALGSIEGRVAIEYFDDGENSGITEARKKYAFKCHRIGDAVYPVNAVAFHPVHETLATGGADGTCVIWDAVHKKRLTAIQPRFPSGIAAITFSADGKEVAVASSYTFEEGERDAGSPDEIYVREVLDVECRPKKKI